jgi:hypothetical protein
MTFGTTQSRRPRSCEDHEALDFGIGLRENLRELRSFATFVIEPWQRRIRAGSWKHD